MDNENENDNECVKKYLDTLELELDLAGDLLVDVTLDNVNDTLEKITDHVGLAELTLKEAREQCNIESGTFAYQRELKKK